MYWLDLHCISLLPLWFIIQSVIVCVLSFAKVFMNAPHVTGLWPHHLPLHCERWTSTQKRLQGILTDFSCKRCDHQNVTDLCIGCVNVKAFTVPVEIKHLDSPVSVTCIYTGVLLMSILVSPPKNALAHWSRGVKKWKENWKVCSAAPPASPEKHFKH